MEWKGGQEQAYTEFKAFMNDKNEHIFGLFGSAGCVDRDTEFLTPNGWKKIADYAEGDLVCQWNPNKSTSFEKPEEYHVYPSQHLDEVKSGNFSMTISKEHRVPHFTSRGAFKVKHWHELEGRTGILIPRGFTSPVNAEGVSLSDEYLRVLVMQSADGSIIPVKKGLKFSVNVKRERLISLLEEAGIEYSVIKSGEVQYYAPEGIQQKGLQGLWSANSHQLDVIYDEALRKSPTFSGSKQDCEFIQYVMSAVSGKYATLVKDKKQDIWQVSLTTRDKTSFEFRRGRSSVSEVPTQDGLKYCFKTPSSFWLARKDGKVFPTGNTGKTFVVPHIVQYAIDQGYEKVYVTATTHQAKSVIAEKLPKKQRKLIEVSTIQSLTKMYLSDTLDYELVLTRRNEDMSFADKALILVDEVSMAGSKIVDILLAAKHPQSNTKICFLGDSKQLFVVKGGLSTAFSVCDRQVTMDKTIRFDQEGVVASTIRDLRDLIEAKSRDKVLFETEVDPKGRGDMVVMKWKEWISAIKEQVKTDWNLDDYRILAYTNDAVAKLNYVVRKQLYGDNVPQFVDGEMLIMDAPFFLDKDRNLTTQQRVWVVSSRERPYHPEITPAILNRVHGDKVKVLEMTVKDDYGELFIFYTVERDSFKEFENMLERLRETYEPKTYHYVAKQYTHLKYAHALTVHLAQGTTVNKGVFMHNGDINRCKVPADRLRLQNVALSRSKKDVFIYQ